MTFTFDPEQAFWWVAILAVVLTAWCVLADTGMTVARLALDLDRENKARRLALAKKQQPAQTA